MTSLYLADVFIMVDGVMKKLDCYIAYSKIEYDCLLNVEILNQIWGDELHVSINFIYH